MNFDYENFKPKIISMANKKYGISRMNDLSLNLDLDLDLHSSFISNSSTSKNSFVNKSFDKSRSHFINRIKRKGTNLNFSYSKRINFLKFKLKSEHSYNLKRKVNNDSLKHCKISGANEHEFKTLIKKDLLHKNNTFFSSFHTSNAYSLHQEGFSFDQEKCKSIINNCSLNSKLVKRMNTQKFRNNSKIIKLKEINLPSKFASNNYEGNSGKLSNISFKKIITNKRKNQMSTILSSYSIYYTNNTYPSKLIHMIRNICKPNNSRSNDLLLPQIIRNDKYLPNKFESNILEHLVGTSIVGSPIIKLKEPKEKKIKNDNIIKESLKFGTKVSPKYGQKINYNYIFDNCQLAPW